MDFKSRLFSESLIAVDYGTTNTSFAWNASTDSAESRPEVLRNDTGDEETPSVVYFGVDGVLVGSAAETKIEEASGASSAERHEVLSRVFRSTKRQLLDPPVLFPGGETVRPENVVCEILRKVRRDAESYGRLFPRGVNRMVLTHPVSFDPQQVNVLRRAVQLAGFEEVHWLEEPVAAALAYLERFRDIGDTVMVFDIGGGTSDLAVVRRAGNSFSTVDADGDPRCGGDDFDRSLYDLLERKYQRQHSGPFTNSKQIDPIFLRRCRILKEELSRFSERTLTMRGSPPIKLSVHREELEREVESRLENSLVKAERMIQRAKESNAPLDNIILVGGSCRIPRIMQLVEQRLGRKPLHFEDMHLAVALGAACWGAVRGGEKLQRRATIWRSFSIGERRTVAIQRDHASCVAFSHLGDRLATASFDGTIQIWDLRTFTCIRRFYHRLGVISLNFSPDDALLVSVGLHDGHIFVWDLERDTKVISKFLGTGWLCVFCGSSGLIATASSGRLSVLSHAESACLWSVQVDEEERHGNAHHSITSLAASYDGRIVASGQADGTVNLWDTQSGSRVGTLSGRGGAVRHLAFSPDGSRLVSGRLDGVYVSSLDESDQTAMLRHQTSPVCGLALSLDGGVALTTCSDGQVLRHALGTGETEALMIVPELGWLAISGDSRLLAYCHRRNVEVIRLH